MKLIPHELEYISFETFSLMLFILV